MDSLINTFKSIQLSVSEIILQLQSITLPQDHIEKCQESLKDSNIISILSTIQELSKCGSRSTTKESVEDVAQLRVSPESTERMDSSDTCHIKEEEDIGIDGLSGPIESEVHFAINVTAVSKKTTPVSKRKPKARRRFTAKRAKIKFKEECGDHQAPKFDVENANDKGGTEQLASIVQETIQNLKEDTGSEVPKVCERSQEIRERWKQKLKEGFKREDIKCSTCGRDGFKVIHHYERHEKSHDEDKPFVCQLCNKTFKYKRCVDTHLATVHSEGGNYECMHCHKTFKQKYTLESHVLTHSAKQHKCDKCERCFTLPGQLKSHIRTNHQGIFPYWCKICDRGFKKKLQFEPHLRKHTGEKPFGCETCSKKFASQKSLEKHKILHSGDVKYTCPICEAGFKLLSSFKAHVNRHSKTKDVDCKICGKLFYTKSNLKEHMLTHTGEKNHQCASCGRTFATKSQLIAHLSSHANLKPYTCEVCSQKFRTKSNLDKHTFRKHKSEAEQPFKCEYCAKGLATKVELTHHVRSTHTHERPYKCEECAMEFIASKHLRDHMRIHTGEKPYKCQICSKTFTQSGSLFKHKAVHEKQPPSAKLKKQSNQQVNMNTFATIPVQGPPVKVMQPNLPDNLLQADLSIINENNQTLYELITQVHNQEQKFAVSVHTPEQGAAHLGQMVTTIATQVPDQIGTQAILVQDPQTMQSLPSDFQQINYY